MADIMVSLRVIWFLNTVLTVYAKCPTSVKPPTGNGAKTNTTEQQDPSLDQLSEFQRRNPVPGYERTSFGVPISTITASLTAGPNGPLLQDTVFFDLQAHLNRERIPERFVHAKGYGAFGYFEVTHDITKYTKATVFSHIGKRTKVAARFSTAIGESGYPDTARNPRGFAVKHYTEDGIWDVVGFNSPMFFVRDPILFPLFIHSEKRNPVTHLRDPNMVWDFFIQRPETVHTFLFLYSDLGIPDGFRYMDGFGEHTFKLVNQNSEPFWCKFIYKTDQGIRNLTNEEAARIAGQDPDYSTRDLYNAIHRGEYPSWTLYIQVMTMEQGRKYRYNIFDLTKVWYEWDVPLIPVGKLVLNENVQNFFTDVEQIAFCPGHLIPGIETSPDKMLQGRLFAYDDAQRYRLGANHLQLPINCPFRSPGFSNQQRDAFMAFSNQDGSPNYYPNSFFQLKLSQRAKMTPYKVDGFADRYESGDENNFEQPRIFWRTQLDDGSRTRLVQTIAFDLHFARDFIQKKAVKIFYQVDVELGRRVKEALQTFTK